VQAQAQAFYLTALLQLDGNFVQGSGAGGQRL